MQVVLNLQGGRGGQRALPDDALYVLGHTGTDHPSVPARSCERTAAQSTPSCCSVHSWPMMLRMCQAADECTSVHRVVTGFIPVLTSRATGTGVAQAHIPASSDFLRQG